MATVYSSNYSTGTYTYTRVKVDYSGTSATATLLYSRTNSYSGQTGQIGTFTFGGVSTSYNKYFTGEQTDAVVASVNFTISTSGGTYSGTSTSSGSDHFLDFSGSVTIPAQATAPTGLDANNIVRGVESFTANVYITSWGTGTGARYRELQCWTYDPNDFAQPRRYQPVYGDALSGNITVDNSSSYSIAYGPLTIVGNTKYVLGLYATNGTAGTGSQRLGEYTTLAYAPEVTISSISSTSATLAYSTKADGGVYAKTYEYSIDGGTTWTAFATVSSGSATTGTFTVSGLTTATVTVMQTRVTTTAGTTVGPDITLNTNAKPKLYGSANNQAKGATALYGSDNSQATTITKLYGSAGGQAKLIHQGFGHADRGYGYVVFYTDSSRTGTGIVQLSSQADVNLLGQSGTSWSTTIGGQVITNETAKEVHLTKKVTSIPTYFLNRATYLDRVDISEASLTAIPSSVLTSCTTLNSPITLPATVTRIDDSFMRYCTAFNQPITLHEGITYVGHSFLACSNNTPGTFSQNISLPSTLRELGRSFLYNQANMTGEVNVGLLADTVAIESNYTLSASEISSPAYTTGIKIAGANRAAWLTRFPNSSSSPYRNLIDAGY